MNTNRYSSTRTDVCDRLTWEPLAIAITRARGGQQAGEIARHVLEGEGPSGVVVGIEVEDGEVHALYYSLLDKAVTRTPVTPSGRNGQHVRDELVKVRAIWQQEEWLQENGGDGLVWVHPRWRWVSTGWE